MDFNSYKLYKKAWIYRGAPHHAKKLSKTECTAILRQGGLFVRNEFDFDSDEKTSFWFIIKDTFGGMAELSSKVRNQVRRAQDSFEIRRIDKEKMLNEGYEVHRSAMLNYKVKSKLISETDFIDRIKEHDANYHYWGCLKEGDLVAFAINHIYEEQCNYETFKAKPEYLQRHYPFYGLIYEMNCYYLEKLKLKYVCDGARSITEHSNIQSFLEDKFKFRKAYSKMSITYQWWVKLIIDILFPFRKIIKNQSVKAILKQEEIARNFK